MRIGIQLIDLPMGVSEWTPWPMLNYPMCWAGVYVTCQDKAVTDICLCQHHYEEIIGDLP